MRTAGLPTWLPSQSLRSRKLIILIGGNKSKSAIHPPLIPTEKNKTSGHKYNLGTLLTESKSKKADVFPRVTRTDYALQQLWHCVGSRAVLAAG